MENRVRVLVVSDIHYAGPAERDRKDHESRVIPGLLLRTLVGLYRRYFWLRDVFAHNHLLDDVIQRAGKPDWVVANGDYSCDTAFVGCSDEAAYESAAQCLGELRRAYGGRLLANMGDHELGKKSIFGGAGGLRWASWERAVSGLGLNPLWSQDVGVYCLMGVTSSLLALPVMGGDIKESERNAWEQLREGYILQIEKWFDSLDSKKRVILFCHDPSALPFLAEISSVRKRLDQVERTVIGHLHSDFILGSSRLLGGMPQISFLGVTVNRLSAALRMSRAWGPFKVVLCPSLAGIELLKDGAFLEIDLDPDGNEPVRFRKHRLPWGGHMKKETLPQA